MKIVFSNLPMKKDLHGFKYKVDGNAAIEYDGEVVFPVNSVLARIMKRGEKVKVILLSKVDIDGNSALNAGMFQKELNEINRNIGAVIEYTTLSTPFEETRDVHEMLLKDMVSKLEQSAEILCDVTYGPKPLPIVMFTVMNFAEKFFKAKILNIVYGKVDFVVDGRNTGKTIPINPVLYDLTPLYYLNSVTNAMEYKNAEDAVKALDAILDI